MKQRGVTKKGLIKAAVSVGLALCMVMGTVPFVPVNHVYAEEINEGNPVISADLSDLELAYGYSSSDTNAFFKVSVEPSVNYTCSYQWYKNDVNSNSGGSAIEGGTGDTFYIPTGKDAGTEEYYYCVVSAMSFEEEFLGSSTTNAAQLKVVPKTIENPTVTFNPESFTYNGSACEPAVSVKDGETTIPTAEYSVEYSDNIDAGEATVTIKDVAGGNYTIGKESDGYKVQNTFSIGSKAVEEPEINLSQESFEYNGSVFTPTVTVMDGNTEIPATEYTVEYIDNVKSGQATVKVIDNEGGNYIIGKSDDNYEMQTSFTINKAEKPSVMPEASQKVAYKNAKVGDVQLPENWQWKESDYQLTLTVGKFLNATAEYVGEDADCYKKTTVGVDISRLACDHSNTELRNFKAATTTEKGYTGDTYCKDCGKIISLGQEKNKLPSSSGSETKADGSDKNTQYKNEWVNGKWYNEVGVCDYEGTLTWKSDSTGWWVEDTAGWYPQSQWQKIDGEWYYFKASGYMASGEYFNGYWFNSDGTMDDTYYLTWKSDSTGWWVEDMSGWWPSSQWLQIDGYWYYFNASGYMVTNQYVDGYWLGSDGACQ